MRLRLLCDSDIPRADCQVTWPVAYSRILVMPRLLEEQYYEMSAVHRFGGNGGFKASVPLKGD